MTRRLWSAALRASTLARLKQPGHRPNVGIAGVAEMLVDAERRLGRAQQRIMVVRRRIENGTGAVIGDDERRNMAAAEIGQAVGIGAAAALIAGRRLPGPSLILVPGDDDRG